MSLRDQAIQAMMTARFKREAAVARARMTNGIWPNESEDEAALDGLLQWLAVEHLVAVEVHGGIPLGVLPVDSLCDLLAYGGEETS